MSRACQITTVFILTTTAALSNSYEGISFGGGLGLDAMRSESRYTDISGSGKTNFNKFGIAYHLKTSYLTEIGSSKTIVGGEIYINGSSAKKENSLGINGSLGSLNLKRSPSYGVAVIVGTLISPKVMIYGRSAYELSRYSMNLKLKDVQPQSIKKTYSGIVPGAGIDYKVAPNMIAGLSYEYAGLFKKKTIYEQGNQKIEVKPSDHRILAKISLMMNLFS